LLVLAAATDVIDGSLARNKGSTRLGRDIDAATDALVGLAAVRAAGRAGWLTPGAARLALARYALPVAAVTVSYFRTGRRLSRSGFGDNQAAANVVLAALIASPTAPRLASVVARAASLATLALAARRRRRARRIHF
jgi:phosphatidylglycerophosphate synthase